MSSSIRSATLSDDGTRGTSEDGSRRPELDALAIAWYTHQPNRAGEVALVPADDRDWIFGRGTSSSGRSERRLSFYRQRPGSLTPGDPVLSKSISRDQLRLRSSHDGLKLTKIGRCAVRVNGELVDQAVLRPGETVMIGRQLLLLCVTRPLHLSSSAELPKNECFTFGGPDANGIVGESPAVWALRERIGFIAQRDAHVMVTGPSGVGKELVSRALHDRSSRAGGPLVSRNAATFPEGLIDAELFGNIRDYPNPGMRERPGLMGAAHGGTLFLDEIGELPEVMQAHLLRVLDSGGSYQRLGESFTREADVRLIAATNRDLATLRTDFLARFALRLKLEGLDGRREDIPLLILSILERISSEDVGVASRFFDTSADGRHVPRVDPALVDLLVRHRYEANVRELEGVLWRSMSESERRLDVTDDLRVELGVPVRETSPPRSPVSLTVEEIQSCLDRHDGNQAAVWKELGLKNRYVLRRLVKKHSLVLRESSTDDDPSPS